MKEFALLQEQFQQFVISGQPGIHDSVLHTESVSVEDRLAIYRNAYKLRLIESLTTSFPALHVYLGTEAFEGLCSSYIDAHPSTYKSIRWYGDTLAHFMKNYFDKPYSFLSELAEFEWNMTLAFDAPDDPVLQVADMAALAPESWVDVQFIAHSSLHRQDCLWNSIPLWQSLIHDKDLPELLGDTTATPYILWRSQDFMVRFYSLSEAEAWALDALLQGATFAQICEGFCQWFAAEEVGMQAASYLKNWIQNGMLSSLSCVPHSFRAK